MKFLIQDNQSGRHEKIRSYLTDDNAIIAVLLAAIDLEWTLRRTIDAAASKHPLIIEKLKNSNISGLKRYETEWNKVCVKLHKMKPLNQIVSHWEELDKYYQIRHDIIHGRVGSTGLKYATKRIELILNASVSIAAEGKLANVDPYKKLARRGLFGSKKT